MNIKRTRRIFSYALICCLLPYPFSTTSLQSGRTTGSIFGREAFVYAEAPPSTDAESTIPLHTDRPEVPRIRDVSNDLHRSELEAGKILKAIELSADYLARQCMANGKFVYRINLDPEVKLKKKYNVLRHAGTMYALAMFYEQTPNQQTRDVLLRSGRYLKERCISPLSDNSDMSAVWSKPEISGGKKPLQAKLGGTGLGLVALLCLEKVEPETTPLEELRRLGRFVIHMQKDDGSFYSKYIPSEGGRQDSWTSLYYPGEAALGLLMLYEQDPSRPLAAGVDQCTELFGTRSQR